MRTLLTRALNTWRAHYLRRRGTRALRHYLHATDAIAYTLQEAEKIAPSLKRLRIHGKACSKLARRYRLEALHGRAA